MVFGARLVTDYARSGVARGVAVSFLVLGLLMSIVGAVVGWLTQAELVKVHTPLQATTDIALAAERERVIKLIGRGVTTSWPEVYGG